MIDNGPQNPTLLYSLYTLELSPHRQLRVDKSKVRRLSTEIHAYADHYRYREIQVLKAEIVCNSNPEPDLSVDSSQDLQGYDAGQFQGLHFSTLDTRPDASAVIINIAQVRGCSRTAASLQN